MQKTAKPIDNLGDIVPNLHSKPIEIALLKYSDPRNLNIDAIDITCGHVYLRKFVMVTDYIKMRFVI